MSDFSDRPFVAGSLVGLRAFRVDGLGRLTGVTHKDVWTPGENVAQCHKPKSIPMSSGGYFQISPQVWYSLTTSASDLNSQFPKRGKKGKKQPIPAVPTPAEKADSLRHEVAAKHCDCGFYAYFDGGNDYLSDTSGFYVMSFTAERDSAPRIGAIVEGYGVCTVGSRGFRASKARILAFVDPQGESARSAMAFERVRHNYSEVQVFQTERDAIRAFPLTDPIGASPADEDFWTRSAR